MSRSGIPASDGYLLVDIKKCQGCVSCMPDGYMAEGVLGQSMVIIPSKDLVIVRVANETGDHMDLVRFLTMILSAVES